MLQGTGTHFASGNHWIVMSAVLRNCPPFGSEESDDRNRNQSAYLADSGRR